MNPHVFKKNDRWLAVLEDPEFGPQTETETGFSEGEAMKNLVLANPELFPWQCDMAAEPGSYEFRRSCYDEVEADAIRNILGTLCDRPIEGSTVLRAILVDEETAVEELEEYGFATESAI